MKQKLLMELCINKWRRWLQRISFGLTINILNHSNNRKYESSDLFLEGLAFEHALLDVELEESGEDEVGDDGEGQVGRVLELQRLEQGRRVVHHRALHLVEAQRQRSAARCRPQNHIRLRHCLQQRLALARITNKSRKGESRCLVRQVHWQVGVSHRPHSN
jgi:hypothetical protein